MSAETATLIKDVCLAVLFGGVPIAVIISTAVSGWKERHRHIEVNSFIRLLTEQNRRAREDNVTILENAIHALARQKSLIVMQDNDGYLTVKAFDTAEKEEVREALKKQDKWGE